MSAVWLVSPWGGSLALLRSDSGQGFMDALPDPMKLDPFQIGFVILLIAVLYLFLKVAFFKPLVALMEDRETAIAAGAEAKAQVAARVEQRQDEYQARLKELRVRTFEHRKALASAAEQERQALLEKARTQASETRSRALADLVAQRETARRELIAQVDALSESIAQHLLKRA